jgi:hypothetical protein
VIDACWRYAARIRTERRGEDFRAAKQILEKILKATGGRDYETFIAGVCKLKRLIPTHCLFATENQIFGSDALEVVWHDFTHALFEADFWVRQNFTSDEYFVTDEAPSKGARQERLIAALEPLLLSWNERYDIKVGAPRLPRRDWIYDMADIFRQAGGEISRQWAYWDKTLNSEVDPDFGTSGLIGGRPAPL